MRECNLCRKFFYSSTGRLCRSCSKYLEEIYWIVRSFIRDSKNPGLNAAKISDALAIPVKYVQGLVDYGYLNIDLPHAQSSSRYENRARLIEELQKSAAGPKSITARGQAAITYGQARYGRKR